MPRIGGSSGNDFGKVSWNRKMTTLKLATWNVRTMLQAGKMEEIAGEVQKYGMDLVALQEIRWVGNGRIRKRGYDLFYSGPEIRTGQAGTGFIISSEMRKNFIGFEPLGDRLCKIRFKGYFRNISIISAYAPTEDASDEEKSVFYSNLDKACNKVPKYDVLLILGDFNAKIGKEDFLCGIAGMQSLHDETSPNGILLVQFAESNQLLIRSTCFQHKDIYKGTWKTPGMGIVNQIDHILVSKRHASSVIDVKSARGPNCDSDHFMVKALFRERLSMVVKRNTFRGKLWNSEKLTQSQEAFEYQKVVTNKLIKAQETIENGNLEGKWQVFKESLVQSAEEVIGKKENIRNEGWFDQECKLWIDEKNKKRKVLLQRETRQNYEQYKEARRKANQVIRMKKRNFIKANITKLEEFNFQNESKKFYQALKKMTKGFQPRVDACKDQNGSIIVEEEKVLDRWAEFFEDLLNVEENQLDENEKPAFLTAEPYIIKPSIDEIEEIIKQQRNGKAPGEDQMPVEFFKYGGKEMITLLHKIIIDIWDQEEIPKDWKKGLICPIFKNGDKMKCQNYRGITLLNVAYKIFSSLIQRRLSKYAEEILGDYQCGFRPGRGTTDQIFVLRQSMEKCFEYKQDLHILFIDFQQAFDSLNRNKMMYALEGYGIPKKLVKLISLTLQETTAKVIVGGKLSKEINISTGVRQGDAVSAVLFNLTLHEIMKDLSLEGSIIYKSYQVCAYADDIALVARSKNSLIEVFNILEKRSQGFGLKINEMKTKYMLMTSNSNIIIEPTISVGNYSFQCVDKFCYLGSTVNNKNIISEEIYRRIMTGNRAYYCNLSLLKSSLLSRNTKLRLYKTLIRPVVTYGAESWTMSKANESSLRIFERKILRKIYGPVKEGETWRIRTNQELEQISEREDIVRFIKSRRLMWLGHIKRMPKERMPYKLLCGEMNGIRKRGRPRKRWLQSVEEDLKKMGITRWWEKVFDREEWRHIVREAKAHPEL